MGHELELNYPNDGKFPFREENIMQVYSQWVSEPENIVSMKIVKLHPSVRIPVKATKGSSCYDVEAYLEDQPKASVVIPPFTQVTIPTGLAFGIPQGWEVVLRSRSGLSLKGIVVANSPATIDSDYTGEVKVIIRNNNDHPIIIADGERIAQMTVSPTYLINFNEVNNLERTERGSGGFGSTGV